MAIMQKFKEEKDYVQVPNETAKAVEKKCLNPISLQALGLLTNLWCYDIEKWEVHKTELYNRFGKNKRHSVSAAWDELIETRYIMEFEIRNAKGQFDYVYVYNIKPFNSAQIEAIEEEVARQYNILAAVENQQRDEIEAAVDFPQRENRSGLSAVGNQHLTKTKETKDLTKEKLNKTKLTTSSSLVAFEILDVKLKNKYPNLPFDEIKAKMLEEAESGKCTVSTAKQYSSLLEYRLKNYIEPKPSEPAQIRTKQPIRTEYIPDYMGIEFGPIKEPEKPVEKSHDENELERKRMLMDLNLKKFRGEITEEEYKIGVATLE